MAQRKKVPSAVKEGVLREFRHRCAICGHDDPHIHHINGDSANNEPMNLLPLCPNCHLTDHHDPTAPVDSEKVALFRHYKDPTILKPQFGPLFTRLAVLKAEGAASRVYRQAAELVSFVRALDMGDFYGGEIEALLSPSPSNQWFLVRRRGSASEDELEKRRESGDAYIRKVRASADRVRELIVELLRYQHWRSDA